MKFSNDIIPSIKIPTKESKDMPYLLEAVMVKLGRWFCPLKLVSKPVAD
jgi:hypothetical protein